MCDHENYLEIEKSWRVNKPMGFWQSGIGDKSSTFSFSFLPLVEFYIQLEAHRSFTDWSYFKLTADCELEDPSDFAFHLWAENDDCDLLMEWKNNKEVESSEDREVGINERVFLLHECKPMEIHCKIEYRGECPLCLREEALIDIAIKELQEEQQRTITSLKAEVERLKQPTNKRKRKFSGDQKEENLEKEVKRLKIENKECSVKLKEALKEASKYKLLAEKLQKRLRK
ncbi:hypothetical protein M3Y94_00918800 [Aphelenchoides besseyi]|nr:hypothetical protein M3Y94_00918800 [Aphelenchoides besseyi]KAI6223207.1 hypothetical protein M3Y95_00864900 [Aphelenchoides besseyi]